MLTAAIFLPLAAALAILSLPERQSHAIRWLAAGGAGLTLLLVMGLWAAFEPGAGMQFVTRRPWIESLGVFYATGLDGLSLPLVALTALLFLSAIVFSWNQQDRAKEWFAWMLFLEAASLGVFAAGRDVSHHRDLGTPGGKGRGLQVLHLHFRRIDGAAAGRDRPLPVGRGAPDDRDGGADRAPAHDRRARLAARAGLLRPADRLHDQDTRRAGPHLAAARARPGTGGGVADPGRRAAEDGHLRLLPHPAADAAGSDRRARIAGDRDRRLQRRLRRPACAGADRSETAGRLYQRQPHGLHRHGCGCGRAGWRRGRGAAARQRLRGAADGQSRPDHRFAVPADRCALPPQPYFQIGRFSGLARPAPLFAAAFGFGAFASLGLPGLSGFVAEFQIFLGTFGIAAGAAVLASSGIVLTAGLFLWTLQRLLLGETPAEWQGLRDMALHERLAILPLLALVLLIGLWPAWILQVIGGFGTDLATLLGR